MTIDVPVLVSEVAVIVTDPLSKVVTSPELFTVASNTLLDDHPTERPVSTLPAASLSVAVSCTVWPAVTLGADGATVTVATGAAVTVTADDPETVPTDAVMLAAPAARHRP